MTTAAPVGEVSNGGCSEGGDGFCDGGVWSSTDKGDVGAPRLGYKQDATIKDSDTSAMWEAHI